MKPVENLTDDEFSHQVQRAVRALPDAPLADEGGINPGEEMKGTGPAAWHRHS